MLRSYWIVALVLGLMWSLATASAQQASEPRAEGRGESERQEVSAAPAGQQEAAPEQDDAADPVATIEGVERAVRALIPEESAEAREQDRQRDEADLRAQERMVLWTFWMFVAAAFSVVLTAVGVALIWRTLLHTRDAAVYAGAAVDEAKNATKAARDTIEVTRDIGQKQVRAYLSVEVEIDYISDEQICLKTKIRNSGSSPALDGVMHLSFHIGFIPENLPGKSLDHPDLSPLNTEINDIPGQDSVRYEHPVNVPKIGSRNTQTGFLIRVLGYIDYNTVFDDVSDRYVVEMTGFCKSGWSNERLNRTPRQLSKNAKFILKTLKKLEDGD